MTTPRYEQSKHWKPKGLEGNDLSNFRYIPGLTGKYKQRILDLTKEAEFRASILELCPRKNEQQEWEDTKGMDIAIFLEMLGDLPPEKSQAASRIVDEHLTQTLEGGILIVGSHMDGIDLNRLLTKWKVRKVTYESMPTDVLYEVRGGASLAVIRISEGDPETVEQEHVHNGSRLVICLSPKAELQLPGKIVPLMKGDAVWMAPFTLHSFQNGIFLALHTSEAGFDHPEAFLPFRGEK